MVLKPEAALRKDRTTQATLEHRHFAFIAGVIADMMDRELGDRRAIARNFADACALSNPKFNRARFFAACGFTEI